MARGTLEDACLNHMFSENLILHSDLGSQYTSEAYEAKLKELNIHHSFSLSAGKIAHTTMLVLNRSAHQLRRKKRVCQKHMKVLKSLIWICLSIIEGFCNYKRIHSSIHTFRSITSTIWIYCESYLKSTHSFYRLERSIEILVNTVSGCSC